MAPPKESPAAKALAARARARAKPTPQVANPTVDNFTDAEFDSVADLHQHIMEEPDLMAIVKTYGIEELIAGLRIFHKARNKDQASEGEGDDDDDVDADASAVDLSDIADDYDEMSIADTSTRKDLFTEDDTDAAIVGSAARSKRKLVVDDDDDDFIDDDTPSKPASKKAKTRPTKPTNVQKKLAAAKAETAEEKKTKAADERKAKAAAQKQAKAKAAAEAKADRAATRASTKNKKT